MFVLDCDQVQAKSSTEAFKLLTGVVLLQSKSAELTFLMKLMKLQYKDRLTAAHAVSFADSMTMIFQSRESTVAEASASFSSAISVLF